MAMNSVPFTVGPGINRQQAENLNYMKTFIETFSFVDPTLGTVEKASNGKGSIKFDESRILPPVGTSSGGVVSLSSGFPAYATLESVAQDELANDEVLTGDGAKTLETAIMDDYADHVILSGGIGGALGLQALATATGNDCT